MPQMTTGAVLQRLKELVKSPSLPKARELEDTLKKAGLRPLVFGRVNQRSSVEANSESDRGVVEHLVNALHGWATDVVWRRTLDRQPSEARENGRGPRLVAAVRNKLVLLDDP